MKHALTTVTLLMVIGAATGSNATLSDVCLAKKVKAWGKLRQCQRNEQAKAIIGKASDPTKCQTAFDKTVGKLDASAAADGVACRYLSNGDGTITDTKTGLMWVMTRSADIYWPDAMSEHVSSCDGWSPDAVHLFPVCGSYSDWRVPTLPELRAIIDRSVPGCMSGGTCLDPAFGASTDHYTWSSTTNSQQPDHVWVLDIAYDDVVSYEKAPNSIRHASARVVRDAF
jgi:hypothetical protein